METFTVELAIAEGDPYDRSFGILVKSGSTLLCARSVRVAPSVRLGEILLHLDRLILAWAAPQLRESEHIHDTWDDVAEKIGQGDPFPM